MSSKSIPHARSSEQELESIYSSYTLSCLGWQNLHIRLASSNKLHPLYLFQAMIVPQKPFQVSLTIPNCLYFLIVEAKVVVIEIWGNLIELTKGLQQANEEASQLGTRSLQEIPNE